MTLTRAQLVAHLDTLTDHGHPPTCRTHTRQWWTSDDPDDQARAATECLLCPALAPCREYGLAHPKEWGVYGALTTTERQPKSNTKEIAS